MFSRVMVTGHRPQLMTIEQSSYANDTLLKIAKKLLKSYGMTEMISGLALGADTMWADISVKLNVPLAVYIPFPQQANRWSFKDQQHWNYLREQATRENVISDKYSIRMLHARNDAMIKDSDLVVAVWSPRQNTGGTASAVKKVRQKNKPMILVDLDSFKTSKENF